MNDFLKMLLTVFARKAPDNLMMMIVNNITRRCGVSCSVESCQATVSIQHHLLLVPHRQACRASPDTQSLHRAHGSEITVAYFSR